MFAAQQHISIPLRDGPHEDIAVHTYDVHAQDTPDLNLALLEASDRDGYVNLWLFESEIRDLRDALNKVLGEG